VIGLDLRSAGHAIGRLAMVRSQSADDAPLAARARTCRSVRQFRSARWPPKKRLNDCWWRSRIC
jgi:hypothetical protein